MTSKQTHSDTSGSRRMAWMDWFGLIALGQNAHSSRSAASNRKLHGREG